MSPGRFKAMGCEIVVGGATPSEQVAVERLFAALEAALSRFRPTSDLERLNRSPAGTNPVRVTVRGTGPTPILGADLTPVGAVTADGDGADISITISRV